VSALPSTRPTIQGDTQSTSRSQAGYGPQRGAQTYHDYETAILQTLLGWNAPYLDSASPDDFGTTILAALAHELGHVRWYDTFVKAPGGGNDLKGWCNGGFFGS
jgi:hypothetical protein